MQGTTNTQRRPHPRSDEKIKSDKKRPIQTTDSKQNARVKNIGPNQKNKISQKHLQSMSITVPSKEKNEDHNQKINNNNLGDTSQEKAGDDVMNSPMSDLLIHPTTTVENESESKSTTYKTRLFLGEANFSYTRAFLQKHLPKHPNIGRSIIATEFKDEASLINTYEPSFLENKDYLISQGIHVETGVDARELGSYSFLNDRRIKRIHFNFPHDGRKYDGESLPEMIKNFFKSANEIQKSGDRIHVALPHPPTPSRRQWYTGYIYGIYNASKGAGYNLIKKRKFGAERYPGYEHVQTKANKSADVAENAKEYI